MKKLLAITIVFTLLGVAGGAAFHFLILKQGDGLTLKIDVSPPGVPPLGEHDFPLPAHSTLAVQLDLPVSALEVVANENVPQDISGTEQKNLHRRIQNGTIQYRIRPGLVALQNSGTNLTFSLPIRGAAQVTGNFDASFINFPIQSSANLGGHIYGTVTPIINPDWQLIPNLNPFLNLSQANVTLGKLGMISATSMIQNAAEPLIKKEAAKLSQAVDLKQYIEKLWTEAHINRLISEDPPAFASVDPHGISMGPIDYSNPQNISLTLAMDADSYISSYPGNTFHPEPLPQLMMSSYHPTSSLQIPVVADIEMLNSKMGDQSFTRTSASGSSIAVKEPELRVGQNGFILLGFHLTADSGLGRKLSGRVWVQAKPELDVGNQILGFSDISLTQETLKALPKSAKIMLESQLISALTSQLKVQLNKYLPEFESEIHKQIAAQKLPGGVDLIAGKPKIRVLRIYTVTRPAKAADPAPGIVVLVGVKGDLTARVSEIK